MADKMTSFFGLDTPSGQAALVSERAKLEAEIKAAFRVPIRLLGEETMPFCQFGKVTDGEPS